MDPFLLKIATVFIILIILRSNYVFKLRQRWFAAFMSRLAATVVESTIPHRTKLFTSMKDIKSTDPELLSNKQIRILEIGCGSGSNLQYFPTGSRLVMLDLNPQFEDKLRERLSQFPTLQLERLIHASAEDMRAVPSGSVDVVVCTTVLCSVTDVRAVLAEIKRVLPTGGKFYFVEHVIANSNSMLSKVQYILTAIGFWPWCFCGCHLSRDTGKMVQQAGFSSVEITPFALDTKRHFIFNFVKTQIYGVAVK